MRTSRRDPPRAATRGAETPTDGRLKRTLDAIIPHSRGAGDRGVRKAELSHALHALSLLPCASILIRISHNDQHNKNN